MLGSILSGITCAGAFAAFMSTFSGLLVSITGALAHDIYGRILRPRSTPDERMRAFKLFAVVGGACAILLGFWSRISKSTNLSAGRLRSRRRVTSRCCSSARGGARSR